ncbi:MAG: protein nirF [Gammaproteobacteria bacterium]|nr:protein nirF [Gammaproteobacteria bacterium]
MKNKTNKMIAIASCCIALSGCSLLSGNAQTLRATGDMGVVIERATGQVQIVNHSNNEILAEIDGLGDLSHASIVYSRDQRYAYVFGRDGGLTKIDILKDQIAKRIMQSGNSIGGAISQDGKLVAVSNYTPGGVKVFNAETLELVADIKATTLIGHQKNKDGTIKRSKVVGLVDAPNQRFVFSLFDSDEIWIADFSTPQYRVTKFTDIGRAPYDGLISPDGRYYIAGLFGEDGMALLDLWNIDQGVKRILKDYGKGNKKLPVYKMPHLEGWAMAGDYAYIPAVGLHQVLVIDTKTWLQVDAIKVHGQPVFVMAQPDNRQVWINFAFPNNDTIQVIDTQSQQLTDTLTPGQGVLHMEFTPRGENVWLSVRDEGKIQIYHTQSKKLLKELPSSSPSGIFFTNRAHQIGL